jgi:1-phosphatidylinositol phosphodiesterase
MDAYLQAEFEKTLPLPWTALDKFAVSMDSSASRNYSNWMSYLSDKTPISALSIPGTHDSGTAPYKGLFQPYVRTQTMSIGEQLKAGIRYLDIRLRLSYWGLTVTHAGYDMDLASQAFVQIQQFLKANPTEAVIVRIRKELGSDNEAEFAKQFEALVLSYESLFYDKYHPDFSDLQLGDIRGQIFVLQDYAGILYRGADYARSKIEDRYVVANQEDLKNKWAKVKYGLDNARNNNYKDNNLYLTYASGAMGGNLGGLLTPYYVATGEPWPGDGQARASYFGNTPSSYPDFAMYCSKFASNTYSDCRYVQTGINYLLSQKIYRKDWRTGIIAMDFPGSTLIRSIFNTNAQADRAQFAAEKQSPIEIAGAIAAPAYTIKNSVNDNCLTSNPYNVGATYACDSKESTQTWTIPTISQNRPTLVRNPITAQCLDAFVKPATAGTDVGVWSCHAATNQKWTFKDTGNNLYQIKPLGRRDLCLSLENNKTKISSCTKASSHLWRVAKK